jgi:hypothetical protein
MTEPRQGLSRLARLIEILSSVVAALAILGLLYVIARFIRWAMDPNYHLFRR